MSNNPSKFLGQLEKEIMEIVWESKEPITVRVVFEVLSKKRKIAYTTIMTIMGRLTSKGLLKYKNQGKAYIYEATYSKERFLTKASRQIIKNFISSFGEAAVAHFAEEIEKIPVGKRKKLLKTLKSSR